MEIVGTQSGTADDIMTAGSMLKQDDSVASTAGRMVVRCGSAHG